MTSQKLKPDLNKLAENWPAPFVARKVIRDFSGGIIHHRTIANADSKGTGPTGKFSIGRQVAYPVESIIAWMEKKLKE